MQWQLTVPEGNFFVEGYVLSTFFSGMLNIQPAKQLRRAGRQHWVVLTRQEPRALPRKLARNCDHQNIW
jgi:hypothetical protein